MALTLYKDNQELFDKAVLWWQGYDQTATGFPILPSGVTVTPSGTWANPLDLCNSKWLKTFNGSDNLITISNDTSWDFGSGDFTAVMWVKFTTGGVDIEMVGRVPASGSGGSFAFGRNSNNTYKFTAIGVIGCSTASSYTTTDWHFLAFTRTGGYISIYVDIIRDCYYSIGSNPILNVSEPLVFGRFGSYNSTKFNGNMKDLLVYKGRALTVAELTTIMRLTDPRATSMGEDVYPIIAGTKGVY